MTHVLCERKRISSTDDKAVFYIENFKCHNCKIGHMLIKKKQISDINNTFKKCHF